MTLQSISVSTEADEGIKAIMDLVAARRPDGVRFVEVNRANLIRVGASDVLAISPDVFSRGVVALSPSKPVGRNGSTAHVVVRGPLAQREVRDLCGNVDGYDAILRRFAEALSNPEVDSVLVEFDSPGGDVAGLDQCVEQMVKLAQRSGKPVLCYVNEACFSAAYRIASAVASKDLGISLPPNGSVGSIGCIGGIVDETESLKMQGIAVTLERWPAGKAESHSLAPIGDLAKERLSERVKSKGETFIGHVAKSRGISIDTIREFNGGTFDGAAAVKVGLADRVEDFESAVARVQKAGRLARREKEQAMSEEQKKAERFASLEALEQNLMSVTGAKDHAGAIGALAAMKQSHEAAPELNAKLAANEANLATLQKQSEDRDAKAAMDAAQAANKLVPANRGKAEALYAAHGLGALTAFLDILVPVAPAASAAANEPKPTGQTPQQIAASPAASPVNVAQKAYETASPMERHNFRKAQGEEAYAAWKQDWTSRGKPAAAA